ncbi:hypothetical protein B0H16DRAFT_1737345 [Mycena metata]|uniref:Uncharacterized protein n=1 Tax=Mycena metata TaxID=1033252 RepID=A0AAD7HM84_9AGAR|nr:hypothetical protein B0H16DRAFT_1737345 [Mycena metata]
MPAGRPRLDPEVKREHVRASRKLYNEKLREEGRKRMQRKRAAVAASDKSTITEYRESAAAASERYRAKKKELEHAEQKRKDKIKRRRRKKEANILSSRVADQAVATKLVAAAHPKSQTTATSSPADLQHGSRADLELSWDYRRPSAYNFNPLDPLHRHPISRVPICVECDCEGCPGTLIDNLNSRISPVILLECPHNFAAGISLNFARRAWLGVDMRAEWHWAPSPQILMCEPIYEPDAGHEDRYKHTGLFYAVDSANWKGVLTSEDTFEAKLRFFGNEFPGPRTFKARGWSEFMRLWDADCLEWHIHPGDPGIFGPAPPSPFALPPAPSPSSPRSAPTGITTRPPALNHAIQAEEELIESFTDLNVGDLSAKLTREQLAELAAFRPGPGPISPRRLQQQFARVLGPEAVRPPNRGQGAPPPLEPDPTALSYVDRRRHHAGGIYDEEDNRPVPPEPSRQMRHGVQQPEPVQTLHAAAHNPPCQARLHAFYAVSGHSCIFTNKQRATTVWMNTPGADFFFSDDVDEVWEFLGR